MCINRISESNNSFIFNSANPGVALSSKTAREGYSKYKYVVAKNQTTVFQEPITDWVSGFSAVRFSSRGMCIFSLPGRVHGYADLCSCIRFSGTKKYNKIHNNKF